MTSRVENQMNGNANGGMAPVTTAQADQVEQGIVDRGDDQEEAAGMRNLAVIGTFLAALQAQCLEFQNLQEQDSILIQNASLVQAINGMLIIGMLLSTLGAAHAVTLAYIRSTIEYNAAQKRIVERAEIACWRVINFALGLFAGTITVYAKHSQPMKIWLICVVIVAVSRSYMSALLSVKVGFLGWCLSFFLDSDAATESCVRLLPWESRLSEMN
ncbi:hypothetical protein FRC12_014788 [Ceratobasidium sp. 428]|nr:hypothetical protein FRC12_014788 [Ceratobasidium sp. 428]